MDRPHSVNLDAVPGEVAIQWAASKLAEAQARFGVPDHSPQIIAGLATPPAPDQWLGLDAAQLPDSDDSFIIACHGDAQEILVWGTTPRGVVYGLFELVGLRPRISKPR